MSISCVKAEICSIETIDELKSQLENVSFNLEYKKSTEEIIDAKENYFLITANNLPDNFIVQLYYNSSLGYALDKYAGVTIKGGVYTVNFLHESCGADVIKTFTMMVPHYVEDNDNVWFDGTYEEEKSNPSNKKTTISKTNIILLASGALALLLIIVISIILIKKRRKIK